MILTSVFTDKSRFNASIKCETMIKQQHDWNCIDPKPVWPDANAPATGRCFCQNRDVAEQYWKCYDKHVMPCTAKRVDLDWIFSEYPVYCVSMANEMQSEGMALAGEQAQVLPG